MLRIEQNYSLLRHNTFGLDVKTRWFVEYENEDDLKKILSDEYFFSQAFWHIGQGSNLLFLDHFNGVILHSRIEGIETIREDDDSIVLRVGAGMDWDTFVAYCVDNGRGGVENLSLIPGEVGSSAIQNIGAYGVEVADVIETVWAYNIETGEKVSFSNQDCEYGYRKSFFKKTEHKGKYYITQVDYKLSKHPEYRLDYGNLSGILANKEINLQSVREAVIAIRQSKLPDPKVFGNAGSFFMNPYICMDHYSNLKKHYPDMPSYPVNDKVVKVPAAWLIDRCGLKGKTCGGAAVHDKQPLVLINKNNATGNDIALLAAEVMHAVKDKFSIDLHPEVNYI